VTRKDVIPSKILWVDLEMTGLDSQKDVILEVAAEVTDFQLKTLASYEARVRGGSETTVLSRMQANVWWQDYPANRDDFVHKLSEAKPLGIVEDELVELVKAHFGDEPAILAGNSIHNDRGFIKQWWPALDLKLHYRMLDVSSFKVLMRGRYGIVYEKQEVHRAFDDIQASIAELQFYLEWLQAHQVTGA
jgi:oligoribonuclease